MASAGDFPNWSFRSKQQVPPCRLGRVRIRIQDSRARAKANEPPRKGDRPWQMAPSRLRVRYDLYARLFCNSVPLPSTSLSKGLSFFWQVMFIFCGKFISYMCVNLYFTYVTTHMYNRFCFYGNFLLYICENFYFRNIFYMTYEYGNRLIFLATFILYV